MNLNKRYKGLIMNKRSLILFPLLLSLSLACFGQDKFENTLHIDETAGSPMDETVDFKLVKVTRDKVYFDGMTFENVNDDEMNVYVIIGDEGQEQETKFNYRKVKGSE